MTTTRRRHLKVFLCHASRDKPQVHDLYKRLIASGIDAWLDQEKLMPGQDWRLEIPKAVREADVVVICLSNQSITKEGYVQKEIKFALDVAQEKPEGSIFIIPARLEECEVPEQLRYWQWVDLFSKDGYERLIRSLQSRAKAIQVSAVKLNMDTRSDESKTSEAKGTETDVEPKDPAVGRPLKVFLSHASADTSKIRKWYKKLIADGIDAWLDTESLLPGQKWKEEIPKAIRNSDIVIVFLSRESINQEEFVQEEIKEALDFANEKPSETIFIISARVEDCNVPERLADYRWVDLYKKGGYEKIVSVLLAHAKSTGAAFMPARMLKIDEIRSRAVYYEESREFARSLDAYNELRSLDPAYSGIDKKIQDIKRSRQFDLLIRLILTPIALVILVYLARTLFNNQNIFTCTPPAISVTGMLISVWLLISLVWYSREESARDIIRKVPPNQPNFRRSLAKTLIRLTDFFLLIKLPKQTLLILLITVVLSTLTIWGLSWNGIPIFYVAEETPQVLGFTINYSDRLQDTKLSETIEVNRGQQFLITANTQPENVSCSWFSGETGNLALESSCSTQYGPLLVKGNIDTLTVQVQSACRTQSVFTSLNVKILEP